ncbi:MAG: NAD(P)-dependent oxidoreductase, partial [Flavobacterium sp.]
MNKCILITGAQGFLGRYLTTALLNEDKDLQVVGIGRSAQLDSSFTHSLRIKNNQIIPAPLPISIVKALQGRYQYFMMDTNDKLQVEKLLKSQQPTTIIHLASGLKGDHCDKFLNSNVSGTLSLLSACRNCLKGVPFIGISSGGVYGFSSLSKDLPFKEIQLCNPADSYQYTKAVEEEIVKVFCENFDIPWMALRVFNILGPGQDERHVCGRFLSELISIKHDFKDPFLKTSGLTSIRDFVDVRDVAYNIIQLLKVKQYNQVFNIASNKPVIIKDILDDCLNAVFG